MHVEELIAPCLADGSLVELALDTALNLPLYWHKPALQDLSAHIVAASKPILGQGQSPPICAS